MTVTTPMRIAGACIIAGAYLWFAFGARSCVGQHQATVAVQKADEHKAAAATDAAQGAAHDQEAAAQAPIVWKDAAEVARLRATLARLRQAPPAAPVPPPAPGTPEPQPVAPPVDLAAVVAQQDLLIAAQDKQLQDQAGQIKTLTLARDSWRLSAQESAAEAAQLRSALAAKEGVLKAQRWMGRIEGLAVGLGVGYVGGRLH